MKKKDPQLSGRKSLRYRGTQCLNCGQPLDISDIYCPYCSQENSTKQLSLLDFFEQFLSSILVYDSRLRSTFKDLLFRPGIITRNYVGGQRLKYANPFRFFLSVSIIYIFASGLLGILDYSTNIEDAKNVNLNTELSSSSILDSLDIKVGTTASNAIKIADSIKKQKSEKPFKYLSDKELDSMSFIKRYTERFALYNRFYEKHKIKNAETALDSLHHRNTSFNRWIYSKNATIEKIRENPSTFINYIISKIPFFLFFFTPFFAFFFWLIYSRKKYTYLEHMVFIFHIFSFIFLAMLLFTVPDLLLGNQFFLTVLFLFIGPFYFYKALRNFYQQSRIVTLIKFVFLSAVFTIGLSTAAALFVVITAAMY